MRGEAERWLKQSKADMKTAEDCFKDGNHYASAFFCQQAVEKAFKALYITRKKDFPPQTSNLLDLSLGLSLPEEVLRVAGNLTPEFIVSRYPDAAGGVPAEPKTKRKPKEY
ncbi:MAG: HEPN domain-containing protein [Candidatus Jordarchaeales archaeon]